MRAAAGAARPAEDAGLVTTRHDALAAMADGVLREAELVEWGELLGATVPVPLVWTTGGVERRGPMVVAIEGELGTGKTTLVRAICRGFGVTGEVTSPTFALVHRYDAPRAPVYHLDLYRLEGPAGLTNIGWDDIMNEPALVLVEWPERAGERLPGHAVRLRLSHVSGEPDVRLLHRMSPPEAP